MIYMKTIEIFDKTRLIENIILTYARINNYNFNTDLKYPNKDDYEFDPNDENSFNVMENSFSYKFFRINFNRCKHGNIHGINSIEMSIKHVSGLYQLIRDIYCDQPEFDPNNEYDHDLFESYCDNDTLSYEFSDFDIEYNKDKIIEQFKDDMNYFMIDLSNSALFMSNSIRNSNEIGGNTEFNMNIDEEDDMDKLREYPIIHINFDKSKIILDNYDEFNFEKYVE